MTDYSAQIAQIKRANSLEDIREVARQFSAQATRGDGVLYSRPVGNVSSEMIAIEMADKASLSIINRTPRAEFLSDYNARMAIANSAERILVAQGNTVEVARRLIVSFQYGDPNAIANSLTSLEGCLWGDASREFTASMRGDIKVVATAANMERVFGKVELLTILENPNVQTLGGKSVAELRGIAAREGMHALLAPVQAQFVEAAPRGIYKSAGALSIASDPVTLSREFADAMGIDSSRFPPASQLSTSGTVVRANIGMAVQVAQDEARVMRASTMPEPLPTQRMRPTGAVAAEGASGLASADGAAPHLGGNPGLKAAGVAGTVLLAYDFGTSGHKWVQLQSQGNQAGADSTAAHFVGRNVGGAMGGFVAGAGVGALGGSWSGPGALLAGLGGGVIGAYMGDRWAEQKDLERIYTQTDPGGRVWMQDPQGRWLHGAHQQQVQTHALGEEVQVRPVQTALGEDVLFRADYVATGRLERLLNHKAANASYELGLANPPMPQNPFRLDASAEQQPTRTPFETERAFVRDAQSGQWQLEIKQVLDGRVPSTRHEAVSQERALELDQQSRTVIAQNAANSPAAMASRYLVAYEQGRWSDFDPELPPAISRELEKTSTLQASDGNTYTRGAGGQWVSSGAIYNSTANLNLHDELELTLQSQQTGVQEMNAVADHARASPQLEPEGVRGQLAALYATHGIQRSEAQLDAAVAAVERNHARDELQHDFTLELMPDPRTRAPGPDSAIASFSDDGGNHMLLRSTTTAEEVAQMQLSAGGPQETPMPAAPELRIEALSPQEREAHQQALREANRQGVSIQEAQQAATFAALNLRAPHLDETRAPPAVEATGPSYARSAVDPQVQLAAGVPVAAAPQMAQEFPEPPPPTRQRDVPHPARETQPASAVVEGPVQRETLAVKQPETPSTPPAQQENDIRSRATPHLPEPNKPAPQQYSQPVFRQSQDPEDQHSRYPALPTRPADGVQAAPMRPEAQAPGTIPHTSAPDTVINEVRQIQPELRHEPALHTADPSPERSDGMLEANVEATALPDPLPTLQDPITPMQMAHPDHGLYQQVREGVAALDAMHGRTFDATSERMTASLVVLAKDAGLDQVDHVLLSNATTALPAAHNVFVVQGEPGDPAHHRAAMPTAQAAQTSVEESMQQFGVVSQEQQQRIQARQLEQQLHDEREQQGIQARAMSMG